MSPEALGVQMRHSSGLIFLPWTTLAWVIAWAPAGIDGNWEALLIVLGIAMDVVTYMHQVAAKTVQTRRPGY